MAMSNIRIRPTRMEDIEKVAEFAMLANPFAEKEEYKKHLIEELRLNPELSVVAVNGKDEVIGYMQTNILEDIAVYEGWQGKGVNGKLLEQNYFGIG